MIQLHRVSLAVIAFALLGVSLAKGAPTITLQPVDDEGRSATILDVHGSCELYLKIEATGTGPLSYQWKKGGVNVSHPTATQPILNILPSLLAHAGVYTCVVTDSTGSVPSNPINVAAVDIRPRGVLAAQGQATATLKVDAAGTGLAYRWFRRSGGVDTRILSTTPGYAGMNTNTLSVTAIAPGDEGEYFCKVFAYGYAMDGGIQYLGVVPTPSSASAAEGGPLSLTVSPLGTTAFDSLNYQWKKGATVLSSPSATTATLTIAAATQADAGSYTCIVGGVLRGLTVAAVIPPAALAFVVPTGDAKVLAAKGASPVLTFTPAGASPAQTYQWYSKVGVVETLLVNGVDYAGVTTAALTVKAADEADAIDYFCRVTSYGSTNDTGLRSLIVIPAPASTTVAAGETAELTVLPAGASAGTIASMTFQWKKAAALLSTTQTLSIPNAQAADAGDYVCVVTLAGAGSATSPVGKIVVVESAPARVLTLAGKAPELKITASTDTSQTYQWFKVGSGGPDVSLSNGAEYTGVNTKALKVLNAAPADAGEYYCRVTSYGVVANSGLRTLVVIPTPLSRTVLTNSPLVLQVIPAGAPLADFTFQWKKGTGDISGATSDTYTIASAALTDAASYSCVVTLTGVGVVTPPAAKVIVVDSAAFVRLGATGVDTTLPVTVAGLGATFQWFRVVTGSPDEALVNNPLTYTGVTTTALKVVKAPVGTAGKYRCAVTAFGETVSTAIRTLILVPPPDSKLVAKGSPLNLQVFPEDNDPLVTPSFTYQWQKAASTLPGETSDVFTIPSAAMTDNGTYSCRVSVAGAVPPSVLSPGAKVNVFDTAPSTKMLLQGKDAAFTATVTGMGQTYQWIKLDGGVETPLAESVKFVGVATKTLTVKAAALAEAGTYFCRVSVYGQSIDGGIQRLVVVASPASMLVDKGDDLNLEVVVEGQDTPVTYQWSKGAAVLSGETNAEFNIANVQLSHAGDYTALVSMAGVPSVKTVAAKVTVVDHTVAQVLAVKSTDAKLTVSTSGTGQTYQWFRASAPLVPLVDGADYAGATTKVLTVKATDDADAGDYICEVSAFGQMVAVGERTLGIVSSPASTLVGLGNPLSFTVTTAGTITGLNYQWKKGAANIVGATDATYTVPSAAFTNFGPYYCVVSIGGAGPVTTIAAQVAVVDVAAKIVPVNLNATATLSVATSGTGLTFQWHRVDGGDTVLADGSDYSGVTTASLSVTNSQLDDAGDYVCHVTANGVTLQAGPLTLQVHRAPVLGSVTLPVGIVGGLYSYQIPVDADPLRQPTNYAATPLPSGLTVNATTGVISGKPTAAGSTNVTITVSNGAGNDSEVASVTINTMPTYLQGSYVGPLPRNATHNGSLGGSFEMTVTSTSAATGKLTLGSAAATPFSGSLDVIGTNSATATATASITVTRTGLPSLVITFQVGVNSLLTNGVITDGAPANNMAFHGWRNNFSAGSPATIFMGLYNFGMGLPSGDSNVGAVSVPQGVGIGSFTVNNLGVVTSITGTVADGTAVASSTFIGPNGELFIFKPLYTTTPKGSILAELDINDKGTPSTDDNELAGTGTWTRPADPSATQRTYKAGFAAVNLAFEGGRYNAPVAPQLLLATTTGTNNSRLEFEEGGIEHADINPNVNVSIQTGNAVTVSAPNPGTTTLTATPANGQFSGSFKLADENPTTPAVNPNELARTISFKGIIYPKSGVLVGAGYTLIPQIPTTSPPTTATTSPILSGGAFWEKN